MDDLYRENILQHYKNPHHWGELAEPTSRPRTSTRCAATS